MKRKGIWSLSFFPILLTYFIDNFGQGVVFPILAVLFLNPQFHLLSTDLTLLNKTLVLSALTVSFPLARIFGAPFLGQLSDRIGRKKVFKMTILGGIVGYLLTGWGIHIQELALIWIGRAITGFFAGNLTLCLAAIADITETKEERLRNFGWVGTIGSLGFVFAILAGAGFSNVEIKAFYHPTILFFLIAALSVVNFILIAVFFKESHLINPRENLTFSKEFKSIKSSLKNSGISKMYGIYFLFMLSWTASLEFLSNYLVKTFNFYEGFIPYILLIISLIWAITNFLLIPFLARLYSPTKTLLLSLISLTFFFFLLPIPDQTLSLFLISFFLASFSAAICWTTGLATISLKTPKTIQGAMLGFNQSIVGLAFIFAPIVGIIVSAIDLHLLYLITAFFSLLATLILLIRFKRNEKISY